jgi:hypothetical protein
MNVLFHTSTAIAIAVTTIDIDIISDKRIITKKNITTGLLAFVLGVMSHGVLDYVPHCYPINSKIDIFAGLLMIITLTWLTNRSFRPIMFASFVGSVLPDVIDLLPAILNKQLHLNLPILNKCFPWHWKIFSGSIYSKDCMVSTLNHIGLILSIIIILWLRQKDVKIIFKKKE